MYSKTEHIRSYSVWLSSSNSEPDGCSSDCADDSGFSMSGALILLAAAWVFATSMFNEFVNEVAIVRWMDEVPRSRMGGASFVWRSSQVYIGSLTAYKKVRSVWRRTASLTRCPRLGSAGSDMTQVLKTRMSSVSPDVSRMACVSICSGIVVCESVALELLCSECFA